ncbi:transcription factor bHLH155 isoform X2 [Beta vulgaris subsp. vulgaris]|nr:transcription factor bHLH155 isoform X2 [Beta vulgaris subsp. vulgaris]
MSKSTCQIILSDYSPTQEAVIGYGFETNTGDVQELENPLKSAVVDMSSYQYLLGDGMVGRVVVAETDLWIYSDNNESTSELIYSLEYPDEWMISKAVGIKTTLLAPVLPYGILQLGSFQKVAESLTVGIELRDRFFTLSGTTIGNLLSNYDDIPLLCPSLAMLEPENNSDPSDWNCLHIMEYEDMNVNHATEFTDYNLSTADQLVPLIGQNCLALEEHPFFIGDQNIFYPLSLDTNVVSTTSSEFVYPDERLDTTEMWMLSYQEEYFDDGIVNGDSCDGIQNGFVPEHITEITHSNIDNIKGFARDCDIQVKNYRQYSQDSCTEYLYASEGFGLCENFNECGEEEQHVTNVLAASYNNEDITLCYGHDTSISPSIVLTESSPPFQVQQSASRNLDTLYVRQYSCTSKYHNADARILASPLPLNTLESTVIGGDSWLECTYDLYNKNTKVPKFKRGKQTPKTNFRPRPRDRQLIQDRLKELRQLLPDSKKCSIDELLDQTTNHMLFLKSMVEQAEKVKQFNAHEVSTKNSHKNMASKARDNINTCPIIVKDLDHPCQFLIEMICINEGVFFEMAEVMHKLNLTILKGFMEIRCKQWASFNVQALKGFNRLDIFWPLMRILQQNGNWMTDQWCPQNYVCRQSPKYRM